MVRKTVDFPSRKFGENFLDADVWCVTKSEAQEKAYYLKKKGYLARVVKTRGGYVVYTNK